MPSFKLPTSPAFFLASYFGIMLTGIAFIALGLQLHTAASMISGSLLGMYIGLYLPLVFSHVAGLRKQVYASEWLFIAVTLLPVPFWLYAMFFSHISDQHAPVLALPMVTFLLAFLLPSSNQAEERVPVWQTHTSRQPRLRR